MYNGHDTDGGLVSFGHISNSHLSNLICIFFFIQARINLCVNTGIHKPINQIYNCGVVTLYVNHTALKQHKIIMSDEVEK